jgi:hypothetical protein
MDRLMPFPDTGNFFFEYDPRRLGPPGPEALSQQFGPAHSNMPMYQFYGDASERYVPEDFGLRRYFDELQRDARINMPVRGLLG